ncbi:MAG: DUF350 domain-containing protein [Chloroflexota bacterium]|nr:DUF350 domain-containing protein [Chloroflexota bacterium]
MNFYGIVLLWLARVVAWTFICALLAWLGIRMMDALTPSIHQRERIGEEPVAVGLFVAGFLILVGLVIHGVVTGPLVVGAGFWHSVLDSQRLGLVAVSFFVSLLLGIALLHIIDKMTPKIPFDSVEKNPVAAGIYLFGYLVFFGLIIHAALVMPL